MGNLLSWGPDLGSEPDKPNDVSGMSPRDVYQVQRTWKPVYADAVKQGMEMFIRFFRKDPSGQNFFRQLRGLKEDQLTSSNQFKAHVQNVMSSIDSAVANLQEPEIVVALLTKLGKTHQAFKVDKNSFEVFREVFDDVLENDLKLNKDELKSWCRFVDFFYKVMFDQMTSKPSMNE